MRKYDMISGLAETTAKDVVRKSRKYRKSQKSWNRGLRSCLKVRNTRIILTPCQNFIITALTIHF